jgi:cytochrome c2
MRLVKRLLAKWLRDWRVLLPLGAVLLAGGAVGVQSYGAHRKAQLAMALTGGDPSRAPWLITQYGCAGCHAIGGIPGADGKVGPPLKALIERVYIGGTAPNNTGNLVRWLIEPQHFAPHAAMPPPGLSEREARDIAAYLYSH